MTGVVIALLLGFGFFTISSQTILFRQYLIAFNGNEIGITSFFASWLLWIFIGAFAGRKLGSVRKPSGFPDSISMFQQTVFELKRRAATLAEFISNRPLSLLQIYIPLFTIQWLMVANIRTLAGVSKLEMFPLGKLTAVTFIINCPVGFFTGLIFPFTAFYLQNIWRTGSIGILFGLEAAGSFLAGVSVTIMFYLGMHWSYVFLLTVLMLSVPSILFGFMKKSRFLYVTSISVSLLTIAGFFTIEPELFYRYSKSRVLATGKFERGISTETGEIITVRRSAQRIVIYNGSIVEVIPDEERNGAIAGMILAERPEIDSVLILGARAGMVKVLSAVPSITKVYLYFPDVRYYDFIFANGWNAEELKKVEIIKEDPLKHFSKSGNHVDAVILAVGDPVTSVQNRFFTHEYLQGLQKIILHSGLLAVVFTGAENYSGREISNLGISIYRTTKRVFKNVIIKPGETTVLVASTSIDLTDKPSELKKRFKQLPGYSRIFPPEAFPALFNEDRIKYAKDIYEKAGELPSSYYFNRVEKPVAYLFSLLLLGKYTGSPVTKLFRNINIIEWRIAFAIILLFLLFYLFYRMKTGARDEQFLARTIVFSSGFAAMAFNIALIYRFQSMFGSVYLYVGLVTSLFMAGVFLASTISSKYSERISSGSILWICVGISILFFILVSISPPASEITQYLLLFAIAGAITGFYYPQSAQMLFREGIEVRRAGGIVEASDHLGAMIGAAIAGLVLIPSAGFAMTVLITGAVFLIPLGIYIINGFRFRKKPVRPDLIKAGSLLLWFVVSIAVLKFHIEHRKATLMPPLSMEDVERIKGDDAKKVLMKDGYAIVENVTGEKFYIFSSLDYAGDIYGYGGAMNIIVKVSHNGIVKDFFIKRDKETPYYLSKVIGWADSLKGMKLEQIATVDTVTGATVSSLAFKRTISKATSSFFLHAGIPTGASTSEVRGKAHFSARFVYLIVAVILSIILMFSRRSIIRYLFLGLNLALGGILWNVQLSSEQVFSVLSFNVPLELKSFVFVLTVVIPAAVFIFGNFYCGWMCPFGAVQELLQLLGTVKRDRDVEYISRARNVKYGLFFMVMAIVLASGFRDVLQFDPLISIFQLRLPTVIWIVTVVSLLLSMRYPRFWCRYFCIVGAFFSIIGSLKPLNFIFPKRNFHRCDYHVKGKYQFDCIECRRCVINRKW